MTRRLLVLLVLAWCAGWVWQRRAVWFPVLISPAIAIAWAVLFLTTAFVPLARPVTGPALDDLVKGPRRVRRDHPQPVALTAC